MKVIELKLNGIKIFEPEIYADDRGYFFESFNLSDLQTQIGNYNFVQDNFSSSKKNTIRGLHFQIGENSQGKLCQVLLGKVIDVVVDLRKESSTFGQHFSIEISAENRKQIWIPPGFAHGFSVTSDFANYFYKCTNYYNKESERCIKFNDPDLNIDWGIENPIVSKKDLNGLKFKDVTNELNYEN